MQNSEMNSDLQNQLARPGSSSSFIRSIEFAVLVPAVRLLAAVGQQTDYRVIRSSFTGTHDMNLPQATEVLNTMLVKYPNGVMLLVLAGRLQLIKGNVDAVIVVIFGYHGRIICVKISPLLCVMIMKYKICHV